MFKGSILWISVILMEKIKIISKYFVLNHIDMVLILKETELRTKSKSHFLTFVKVKVYDIDGFFHFGCKTGATDKQRAPINWGLDTHVSFCSHSLSLTIMSQPVVFIGVVGDV